MPRFAADDSDVVVVIGSGAGGGTLANELCQRGVKRRAARGRHAPPARGLRQRRVAGVQPAGVAGRAHHVRLVADRQGLPEPAGVDVQGGRRHDGALGRLLPALQGVGVPDPLRARADRRRQPARLADRAVRPRALLRPGRGPDGRHPHERRPGAAGQQQLQGDGQRRQARRLHGRRAPGRMAFNTEPHDGRPATIQDGFNFQGDKQRANWSTLDRGDPQGASRPAGSTCGPQSMAVQIEHDDVGQGRRGVVYLDAEGNEQRQQARVVCVGLQLDRDGAAAAALRLVAVPGRAGQLSAARSGATTCAT